MKHYVIECLDCRHVMAVTPQRYERWVCLSCEECRQKSSLTPLLDDDGTPVQFDPDEPSNRPRPVA